MIKRVFTKLTSVDFRVLLPKLRIWPPQKKIEIWGKQSLKSTKSDFVDTL